MTAPHQEPPGYAWIARLARVGVASVEERPRIIDPAAVIRVAPRITPLTDPDTRAVGCLLHVHLTDRWLYAFGLVHDGNTADQMASGSLVPQFALTDGQNRPPDGTNPLIITGGNVAAVRAVHRPRSAPGPTQLWSGLGFTVEEFA